MLPRSLAALALTVLAGLITQGGCAQSDTDGFILLPDAGTSSPRAASCGSGAAGSAGSFSSGGSAGSTGGSTTGGTLGTSTAGAGGVSGDGGSRATGGSFGTGGVEATGGATGTAGISGAGGTSGRGGAGGASSPTFKQLYQSILTVSCTGSQCHSPGVQSGVSFASQSSAYSAVKARVVPGNASSSSFYALVNTGRMPPGGQLPSSQLAIIAAWINAGALNN